LHHADLAFNNVMRDVLPLMMVGQIDLIEGLPLDLASIAVGSA
jgi:hypothetical protein